VRKQAELIKAGEWDVLLILDACRADYFAEVCEPAEVVRSPAGNTTHWIQALGGWFESQPVAYVTGNPVVNREFNKRGNNFHPVSVWGGCWGVHTRAEVPSVHPQAVNGYVAGMGYPPMPWQHLVVHYIQPHAPYIGEPPLGLSRPWKNMPWAKLQGEIRDRCFRPDEIVGGIGMSWEEVRAAYRGNLRLVWQAARQLAREFIRAGRRVVVTSDHGEFLGEQGRFGHEWEWGNEPILREVPWLELAADAAEGRRQKAEGRSDGKTTTEQKLEALGYA